jgi:trk system potassium uptake protein TrkA
MATILLRELGAKYILARAADERHAKVLEKLGADRVVLPESDIGRRIGLALSHEGVQQYTEFSEDTAIVEMEVPARWVGKTLLELDVRKKMNINVITVKKKNVHKKGISVDPNAKFSAGDTVTVIGQQEDIRKMLSHQRS